METQKIPWNIWYDAYDGRGWGGWLGTEEEVEGWGGEAQLVEASLPVGGRRSGRGCLLQDNSSWHLGSQI